ncbi:unnamed protein product [Echinostoma caproni]|uniref:Protein kinase domain-containing protein n=1 Tax=Echinostoma caproni TaxID=27848 RepID=A0A183AWP7_9TREM|nr:unnamed protein product [Echinostoma caproni]
MFVIVDRVCVIDANERTRRLLTSVGRVTKRITSRWIDKSVAMPRREYQDDPLHEWNQSRPLHNLFSPSIQGSIVDDMALDADEEVVLDTNSPTDDHMSYCWADETTVIRNHQTRDWSAAFAAPHIFADLLDNSVFVLASPAGARNPGDTGRWVAEDCVSQRLLPHINGINRLLDLAHLSRVDLSTTRMCLANLIQAGVIRALPAPTFLKQLNVQDIVGCPIVNPGWLGLPRLSVLLSDRLLGDACLQSLITNFPEDFNQPYVRKKALIDIFRVYTLLCGSPNFSLPHLISATPHIRFVDLATKLEGGNTGFYDPVEGDGVALTAESSPSSSPQLKVNFLHLIHFGEANGLIHRIRCYPISDRMESVEPETNISDSTNVPAHVTRTPSQSGQLSLLSPIHSIATTSVLKTAASLDEKTWNTVRSTLFDGVHNVDEVCAILTRELCLFGSGDTLNPSHLVSQLADSLVHRLRSKSSRNPVSRTTHTDPLVTANGTTNSSKLPVGWLQPPPPAPLAPHLMPSSRLKDPTFKLVSASTEDPVSLTRARLNPTIRTGHNIPRRMSSIHQGYSTVELRSLVERHGQDEKSHGAERKASRCNLNYASNQYTPVPSLYMVWR